MYLEKELLDEKAAGRKIIGSYCVFVPEEIVLAANATLVGLCSGAEFATEDVEKLGPAVLVPENPQFIGALGAALLVADMN